jgi:hypothetical protein
MSETDDLPTGQYECPYSGLDIDELLRTETWSIEHVIPRSLINAREPGQGENDLFGWEPETRRLNAMRSNLPLILWPTPDLPVGRVQVDGGDTQHYNPLEAHKPRLARRWMYIRATYGLDDDIAPPTMAQKQHSAEIVELVRNTPVGYAEARMAEFTSRYVYNTYGAVWENALYTADAAQFLRDDNWLSFVFQSDGSKRR